MAFEFIENTRIELPDVKESFFDYTESVVGETRKLIIEIAAIHEGLTANYNHYSGPELEAALQSWVTPYAKPILINHDTDVHPLGRVMAARMDQEADKTPFTRLQIAIMDPEAINRVLDQRYMTGSVGGNAKHARCSICQVDWAESKGPGAPCRHQRGKVYEGKLAHFELGGLSFREYSFVNVPADQRSMILSPSNVASESEGDGWVHSAKLYSLDMNNENIVEFVENQQPVNILEKMKKKDAHYTYTNLKGTWLSVSALDYLENENSDEKFNNDINTTTMSNETLQKGTEISNDQNAEENTMPEANETEVVDELDIASVVEQLSEDLATSTSEEVQDEETSEDEEQTQEEEADSTEETDVTSDDAEVEGDQAEETSVEGELETAADETEQVGEENADEETQLTDDDENESEELADSAETDALKAQVEKLTDENTKLKRVMHNMLAERVVDRKIDLGLIEASERAEVIAEHASRSASSLADTLKDLHKIKPLVATLETTLEDLGRGTQLPYATGEEDIVPEARYSAPVKTDKEKAEELFTNVLMGRAHL